MLTSAATSRPAPRWPRTVAVVTALLALTTACTTSGGRAQHPTAPQARPDEVVRYAHLDYPMPGPALGANAYRQASWHLSFHTQDGFPELLVDDDVRDYLSLFCGYVAHGGTSFGGPGAKAPFTARQIDEYARTYQRPQVLTGGFALYRTLDQDERDNKAAKPITMPTMLLTAEGTLDFTRSTVRPLMPNITRAAEVPAAGHWLIRENPDFVTAELVTFFAWGADR
ncbi:alpha/beta fold hydrolase [Micromonospora carbonacea]|uniref:alpha/beta fold hydrolase n=1 Tax=Micromonospora carbonacea TaxID=47853 RepID=UPI003719974B